MNKEIYPVRLKLELVNKWCDEEEKRVLKKYADTSDEGSIIREILIPSDMTFHNLHYVIQRLYGWQNSHLRSFKLDDVDFKRLTSGKVRDWIKLIGILFLGPTDNPEKIYYDDNYTSGNHKLWLKKRYVGPYVYRGFVEDYDVCRNSVKNLIDSFPLLKVKESFDTYYRRTKDLPKNEKKSAKILKVAPIVDLTIDELNNSIILESSTETILERVKVINVLASVNETLTDVKEVMSAAQEYSSVDSLYLEEAEMTPVTKKIIYKYDFGDGWEINITKIDDCTDLLESSDITDEILEEASKTVIENHKPVCIYKKGSYIMDDVGGMGGYYDFLKTIYEGEDKEEVQRNKNWAKAMGWTSRKVSPDKML